jgi:hypothetical protein
MDEGFDRFASTATRAAIEPPRSFDGARDRAEVGGRETLSERRHAHRFVAQHDRVFTRDAPMRAVLDIMETDESVACVGFPTKTTLSHDKSHRSRFPGYGAFDLPRRSYDEHPGLELVPLTQFYDSMHVARTSFYLSFVYGQKRWANLPVGAFIEDTLGQKMLEDIRRNGPSAHAKYRTFIVEDDDKTPMAGHIDGHDPIDPTSPAFARRFERFETPHDADDVWCLALSRRFGAPAAAADG